MSTWRKLNAHAIESDCGMYRVARYSVQASDRYVAWHRSGREWNRIGVYNIPAEAKDAALAHKNVQEGT